MRMPRFEIRFAALACIALAAGCSSAGNGSHAQVLPQMGMPKSVSPALIKTAPMAQTAIQPRSAMHSPPTTALDIQGLNWTQIPGAATQAAAAADGSLWVLSTAPSGPDKYIWHYVSGTWTNIAGLASQLAVAPNGTLYAINSGGGTYAYSGGNWTALGGGASWITAAADNSIYVLSNGGTAGSDQAIWHNAGGVWSQVPGSGVTLAGSFDTGSYTVPGGTIAPGGVYIVNSLGAIYYENTGGSFAQLPANTSALAPTTVGGVFALGYPANAGGNTIYYYNLNAPGWSAQSGAGVSISSNAGELYVIGASGAIYASPVTATATPGVPASFTISGLPSGTAGTAFSAPQAFTVTVKDANGTPITGTYGNPVTLTDSDTSGATTILTSGSDNPPAGELLSSSDTATLNYTGLAIVPATVSAQASGATTGTATFTPTLSPIVYIGPQNGSGNPEIDFYATSGTGSTFAFSASEVGWTNAPYGKALTLNPTGCSSILNSSTSTLSGTSFTENVASLPAAGTCNATLTDGAGQHLTNGITFTYTTSGFGVN